MERLGVFITRLLLHFPLLNSHPEGAPNTEPTRALKGGEGSRVSGGQQVQGGRCRRPGGWEALKHHRLWPTFH